MKFQTPLIRATLVRRYKRFLADVNLPDGQKVTAHCANPGAMTGLMPAGATVWLEPNENPKRKLKFSWKLVELAGDHLACVDTGLANPVVEQALAGNRIAELGAYTNLRREVKYGRNSRIDFLLTQDGLADAYVEVKSVTLKRQQGLAEFPDCVTTRGTKHLVELSDMVALGHRAVMLYVVNRTDCDRFGVAADIDPVYARQLAKSRLDGVEILMYRTDISTNGIVLSDRINFAAA